MSPKTTKPTKTPIITQKHLARVERERKQTRLVLTASIIAFTLIIASIIYGILDQKVLRQLKPVAAVNGEKITVKDFQSQVRYRRQQLVDRAVGTYQFIQSFGESPEIIGNFANQLFQYRSQLEKNTAGQAMLDRMIENVLIRQEAEKRGITVTQQEIDNVIQEAFLYFPNGTPTPTNTVVPIPTSTLNPTQLALVPPTFTPTAEISATSSLTPTVVYTNTPTITPTTLPTLTPTPYTLDLFQKNLSETISSLQTSINFSKSDLIYLVKAQIYGDKLRKVVLAEMNLSKDQEQVWARHILVDDEATVNKILDLLKQGQDWNALAAQYSKDTSNKDRGGDLGWFSKGDMVAEFDQAAFATGVGEVSQPVKTNFGWHIIQVIGHELRPLSEQAYQTLEDQKFSEWLAQLKTTAKITTNDIWKQIVPETPVLPPELDSFIQNLMSQQSQPPQQPAVTVEPTNK